MIDVRGAEDWLMYLSKLLRPMSLISLLAIAPSLGHCELLTHAGSLPASAAAIDFSHFYAVGRVSLREFSPEFEIDDLPDETVVLKIVAPDKGFATILGQTTAEHPDNNYYLGTNGHWGLDRDGFLGLDSYSNNATFQFRFKSSPVASVGAYMNYSITPFLQLKPAVITALDVNMAVLETYTLNSDAPIVTPNAIDDGAFRGITRLQNDIFAFQIVADFTVIDDLRFSRIVPEPTAAMMVGVGLCTLPSRRLRRPQG